MDVATIARCVGRCYVSPAFGESEPLRLSERRFMKLSSATNSDPGGSRSLIFGGKSNRRLSFFRPIMATDESISSRSSDCAGKYLIIPILFNQLVSPCYRIFLRRGLFALLIQFLKNSSDFVPQDQKFP